MRTYSSSDVKLYPLVSLGILWLLIKLAGWVFFNEYNTFSCAGQYCIEQQKTGFFGGQTRSSDIKRYDIVDIDISRTDHFRAGKHRRSHYDYSPILIMKDGTRYPLKLKFCGSKQKAVNLLVKIRGNKNFKETTIK